MPDLSRQQASEQSTAKSIRWVLYGGEAFREAKKQNDRMPFARGAEPERIPSSALRFQPKENDMNATEQEQQAIEENADGYDQGVEGEPFDSSKSSAWQAGHEQGRAVRREMKEAGL